MPTNIPSTGYCIHINRLRQERRPGIQFARTVSDYQCYWEGKPISGLSGQMVERGGPGDNSAKGTESHVRIRAGNYPLAVATGPTYLTFNYREHHVLPGLLLDGTRSRKGILIHPCHDDDHHFLSSIGCINPTSGLINAESMIKLDDSLNRVIAIIKSLQSKLGDSFSYQNGIPGSVVLIEGEPS